MEEIDFEMPKCGCGCRHFEIFGYTTAKPLSFIIGSHKECELGADIKLMFGRECSMYSQRAAAKSNSSLSEPFMDFLDKEGKWKLVGKKSG